ncbi:hypothetical protein [Lactobacillus sp. PV034]|uniref:hypothetical protein n=1 Tax=Lactobacillus sp. PV034 TaxID=2594495 RepID=UPI00223F9E2B|nr:hypothetical protein [Lactobacillus sp. PV034]QNQ81224.1 hypothetical protein FP432_06500 [Lactobacillus sp. PV034]
MKFTTVLSAGLVATSIGAVTSTATAQATSPATTITQTYQLQGTATITYHTPVVVWSKPGMHPIHKYLPSHSSWRYFKVVQTADGQSWYNLGGNQWIMGKYVNFNQDPAIGRQVPIVSNHSVATVTATRGARIYKNVSLAGGTKSVATGRVLRHGSRWKIFATINNGVPAYNLGGNQWVYATDVSVN